jgi:hypothetical protein
MNLMTDIFLLSLVAVFYIMVLVLTPLLLPFPEPMYLRPGGGAHTAVSSTAEQAGKQGGHRGATGGVQGH